MEESLYLVGLAVAGVVAGFVNVLAGGGSVMVFAGLIFSGLSPAVANGTIRMGLLGQCLSAVSYFKKGNLVCWREALLLGLSAIPGAVAGAMFAVKINESHLKTILSIVMCFVLVSILMPRSKCEEDDSEQHPTISPWCYPLIFLTGCYGGFIQAGVGFLIMAILSAFTTASLVQVNILKVCIVLCYTIPVVLVFHSYGLINWTYALILFLGYGFGGWLGASWNVSKGDKIIRIVVAIAVAAMTVKLMAS